METFSTTKEDCFFWTLFLSLGAYYIPVLFFHFSLKLVNTSKKYILLTGYIYITLIAISTLFFPEYYVSSIQPKLNFTFYPTAGPLYIFWIIYYLLYLLLSCNVLLSALKSPHIVEQKRNQIKYILLALIVGPLAGAMTFFLWYDIQIPPFGVHFVPLYTIFVTYSIFKHQLMDIKIILKKTLVYSLLVSVITIFYFIVIYSLEKAFSLFLGHHSIPLAIIIIAFFSIIFIPLKNKIQYFIDKYFFHGSIGQIDEENTLLREEIQKSEKMKVVATLAAGMAHEIKNPLTSIKTFTEFINKKKDDPEFLDKFQDIVTSEVNKIDSIVKQLLEFSKPQELQLKETDINKLLDETLNLLNNDLLKHNIKTEKNYSTLSTIKVDPVQIKQVFLNLLLNAIDAIDKDGKITISTETTNNDQICITIEDTGKGISKEDLKHIFDPFFTKKDSGTGLGLSIVHGIIEKHGGKIDLKSTLLKGTTFIIKII